MTDISLINNAGSLGLEYNAFSLSASSNTHLPGKVFLGQYFQSKGSPNDQWWQISFSAIVAIKSYTISSNGDTDRPKSWVISSSFDNKTWEYIHIVIGKEVNANTEIYSLPYVVNCKHFRMTFKGELYNRFSLNFFDFKIDLSRNLELSHKNNIAC